MTSGHKIMRLIVIFLLVLSFARCEDVLSRFSRFRTEEVPELIRAARFDAQRQDSLDSKNMDDYIKFIVDYTSDLSGALSASPGDSKKYPLQSFFREVERLRRVHTASLKLREQLTQLYYHVRLYGNSPDPRRTGDAYRKAYSNVAQISRDIESMLTSSEGELSARLRGADERKSSAL